jgi:hypothetical protein
VINQYGSTGSQTQSKHEKEKARMEVYGGIIPPKPSPKPPIRPVETRRKKTPLPAYNYQHHYRYNPGYQEYLEAVANRTRKPATKLEETTNDLGHVEITCDLHTYGAYEDPQEDYWRIKAGKEREASEEVWKAQVRERKRVERQAAKRKHLKQVKAKRDAKEKENRERRAQPEPTKPTKPKKRKTLPGSGMIGGSDDNPDTSKRKPKIPRHKK